MLHLQQYLMMIGLAEGS